MHGNKRRVDITFSNSIRYRYDILNYRQIDTISTFMQIYIYIYIYISAVSSRTVDGLTDAGDIAYLFASRYRDLYTSVPYNIDEMQVILNGIDSSLAGISVSKDCILSVSEVGDAVSRLKPHKSEGSSELATDHFINGGRDCLSLVGFLLTAITVHGHVPDSFRRCTIYSADT